MRLRFFPVYHIISSILTSATKSNYLCPMESIKNIAIIGQGNVGSYLYKNLSGREWKVDQYSRTPTGPAQPLSLLSDLETTAAYDLILLCVSDSAIAEVSNSLPPASGIVAHVSGATELDRINSKHRNRAVFYPLMSLKGNSEIDIRKIPFCLEASNEHSFSSLQRLVQRLEAHWFPVNSAERTHLHLAAVLAHNFSNHLYLKAKEVMDEMNLDFRILLPLLESSLQNLYKVNPRDLQTGPALRKDDVTIEKHLELISDPISKDIYKLLTRSIQNTYDEEL